jgi:cobalamin biosynthesis protein CobD/CbiB
MYVELREAHQWPLFHRKGEKNRAIGFIARSMDDVCMYVQLREVQVYISGHCTTEKGEKIAL